LEALLERGGGSGLEEILPRGYIGLNSGREETGSKEGLSGKRISESMKDERKTVSGKGRNRS